MATRDIIVYLRLTDTQTYVVDSSNNILTDNKYPVIYYTEQPTIKLRPLKSDGTPYLLADFSGYTTFEFGIDDDFDETSDPAVFKNTGFTVAEITEGAVTYVQISTVLNAYTTTFNTAISTNSELRTGVNAELCAYNTGATEPALIIQFPFVLKNKILDLGENAPAAPATNYYTKAQADSLLAAKQATITGAATTIDTENLTASKILVSDANGKVAASSTDASALSLGLHAQNTDTGTTGNTFTVDSDSAIGKIIIYVATGAADKSLTITNVALTDDRVITLPNTTGNIIVNPDTPEQGDVIYFDGTNWKSLPHGIDGQYLVTKGHAANPEWLTASGTGDVLGSAGSVDNELVLFSGATGTVIKRASGTGVIRTDSGVVSIDTDVTDIVSAATDIAAGKVELATIAETTAGTDTGRAITPDGLAGSDYGKRIIGIQVVDTAIDTSTGDAKAFFRIPSALNGYNLVGVAACVYTAGTTGTTDIQIRNKTDSQDMLSTKITIDSGETDTSTAATAAVINASYDDVATGDLLAIDIDAVSTTAAKGLFIELTFQLP